MTLNKFAKLTLHIILLILYQNTNAQIQKISNGSFENCSESPCPYPNNKSQFHYTSTWQNFELYQGSGSGTGTVDWYEDNGNYDFPLASTADVTCKASIINAQQGTHFAGMYNNEGIIYDFGSDLPDGMYSFSLWVMGCNSGKFQVWKDKEDFEGGGWQWTGGCIGEHGCKLKENIDPNVGRHPRKLLEGNYSPVSGSWKQFKTSFNIHGNGFRYLLITGNRDFEDCECGNESAYFFVDNVSLLYEECCPTYKLFQFYDIPSQTLEVSDYIKIGERVDAPGPEGEVHIQPGNYVEMHAGKKIELLSGFNPDPNSFLDIWPKPCGMDYSIYQGNFAPIAIPDPVEVTCNNEDLNLNFISLGGATGYEARIYDRWGKLIFYGNGQINSQVVTYCNGLDSKGDFVFSTSGTTYIVYLHLFTCAADTGIQFEINPVFTGDCPSKWDSQEEGLTNNEQQDISGINVYPNPSNSTLTVKCFFPASEKDIQIIDNLGKQILISAQILEDNTVSGTKIWKFDVSQLSPGIYFVNLMINEKRHVRKFVVIH